MIITLVLLCRPDHFNFVFHRFIESLESVDRSAEEILLHLPFDSHRINKLISQPNAYAIRLVRILGDLDLLLWILTGKV